MCRFCNNVQKMRNLRTGELRPLNHRQMRDCKALQGRDIERQHSMVVCGMTVENNQGHQKSEDEYCREVRKAQEGIEDL